MTTILWLTLNLKITGDMEQVSLLSSEVADSWPTLQIEAKSMQIILKVSLLNLVGRI